jgi:hypothetical protein
LFNAFLPDKQETLELVMLKPPCSKPSVTFLFTTPKTPLFCLASGNWEIVSIVLIPVETTRKPPYNLNRSVLHTDGALGWSPVTKDMLDEVNDEEGASGIID